MRDTITSALTAAIPINSAESLLVEGVLSGGSPVVSAPPRLNGAIRVTSVWVALLDGDTWPWLEAVGGADTVDATPLVVPPPVPAAYTIG